MYTSLLFHFRLQTLLPGLSLITCNPSRGFASDGGTNSSFLILLNVRATLAHRHAAVALVTHSHPVFTVREKQKVVSRPTENRKREREEEERQREESSLQRYYVALQKES